MGILKWFRGLFASKCKCCEPLGKDVQLAVSVWQDNGGCNPEVKKVIKKKSNNKPKTKGGKMKKVLSILVVCLLCLVGRVYAEDVVANTEKFVPVTEVVAPKVEQPKIVFETGSAWSVQTGKFVSTNTIRLVEKTIFKVPFAINGGYGTDDKIIIGISANLISAKQLGVTFPVLDLLKIDPMVSYAWGHINGKDIEGSDNQVLIGFKFLEFQF